MPLLGTRGHVTHAKAPQMVARHQRYHTGTSSTVARHFSNFTFLRLRWMAKLGWIFTLLH